MKHIICPKCFEKHSKAESVFICSTGSCSQHSVPVKKTVMFGQKPVCQTCKKPLTVRVCPHCGYKLDTLSTGTHTLGISLVGEEGSGKSNYLAVLINSLKKDFAPAFDASLYPLGGDDTIESYNSEYFRPLFEDKRCVDPTVKDDLMPLIYSLVFSKDKKMGKLCNLIFYDSCGASYQSLSQMLKDTPQVYNSKGIIFLIDASQLFAEKRKKSFQPEALLSRVIKIIRDNSGQENIKQKITVPIAVCLSKLDSIKDKIDASAFINYPSRHIKTGVFDCAEFESSNAEVESIVENLLGKEFKIQLESQFCDFGFFAFSSLGGMPNAVGRIRHLNPHRVEDPLLWILNKNKILKADKPNL